MPTLLVIGASRGIGKATVEEALQQGYNVKALARSASSLPIEHERLQTMDGDALHPQTVTEALTGADCVAQCLGIPFGRQMLLGPVTLFSRATQVLLECMQAHGPQRLIAVTGYGAGRCGKHIHWLQRPAFDLVFGRTYADKSRQERLIENTSLQWTILRPGMLTNGPADDDVHVLIEPDTWANGSVSRASVARVLVNNLHTPDLIKRDPVLVSTRWF